MTTRDGERLVHRIRSGESECLTLEFSLDSDRRPGCEDACDIRNRHRRLYAVLMSAIEREQITHGLASSIARAVSSDHDREGGAA